MTDQSFIELEIEVIPEARLALLDFLTDLSPAGIVEEWEWEGRHGGASVYFEREAAHEKIPLIRRYLDSLRELWGEHAVISYEVRDLTDPGWRTEYQRYFTRRRITDTITVAPPWEEYVAQPQEIVIRIQPGPAFGTGTHETTRLCIQALEEVSRQRRIESLLDVGCGSGIIAVAGALLGIERVVGVESDPDSVSSAHENVVRNGMTDRVTIIEETFSGPAGTYDLVVANLTTREIEKIADALVASIAPGGSLVLSGILDEEQEKMVRILADRIQSLHERLSVRRLGEWLCFVIGAARADKTIEL